MRRSNTAATGHEMRLFARKVKKGVTSFQLEATMPVDGILPTKSANKLEFAIASAGVTHYLRAPSAAECSRWLRALGQRHLTAQ